MLSVLLTILKVIGIVLAVLLGIVIVLLLLLLFVPLRYDILAKYYDDKPYAKVNVTALFKLVRFRLEFIDKVTYWVKVLFFKVYSSEKADEEEQKTKTNKKSKNNIKESKKTKKSKKDETIFDEEEGEDDSFFDSKEKYDESDKVTNTPKGGQNDVTAMKTDSSDKAEDLVDPQEPQSFFEKAGSKISGIYEKIKAFLISVKEKLCSAWESVVQKKEDATKKVNDIIRIVNDEGNREFVRFVWEQLKYLFKKLKPKAGHLYVHFGMDDPETTGKIAMYLAVLYGLLGIDINVLPDFDEKVMEGELYLKGKLQLITIVIIAVKLYMNKHFKRIVLKKEF